MTITFPAPSGDSAELRRALATLTDCVEALLAGEGETAVRRPADAALTRVLARSASPGDAQVLDAAVTGGRVVAISRPDARSGRLATVALENDRDVVAITTSAGHAVAVLRGSPRRAGADRALPAARRIALDACRQSAADLAVTAGISARLTGIADLPAATRDAVDAAVLAGRRGTGLLCVDEVWAEVTLARLVEALPAALPVGNPVAALAEADDRQGSDLLRSVTTWLRNNQETAPTAGELRVHPNTLRYRLRRASEVGGIDLDDHAQRLVTALIGCCGERP